MTNFFGGGGEEIGWCVCSRGGLFTWGMCVCVHLGDVCVFRRVVCSGRGVFREVFREVFQVFREGCLGFRV